MADSNNIGLIIVFIGIGLGLLAASINLGVWINAIRRGHWKLNILSTIALYVACGYLGTTLIGLGVLFINNNLLNTFILWLLISAIMWGALDLI